MLTSVGKISAFIFQWRFKIIISIGIQSPISIIIRKIVVMVSLLLTSMFEYSGLFMSISEITPHPQVSWDEVQYNK